VTYIITTKRKFNQKVRDEINRMTENLRSQEFFVSLERERLADLQNEVFRLTEKNLLLEKLFMEEMRQKVK
jgi:hypothetical protein